MLAEDVMTAPPVTVTPQTRVKTAAGLLVTHGFTALPVVDADDHLLGMISEADLVRDRFPRDPRHRMRADADDARGDALPPTAAATVGEVMTRQVTTATPHTDVADVVTMMLAHGVRTVPVVDGERLVGVVTRRDLVRALARDDEAIARAVRHRLAVYGGSGRWTVQVRDGEVFIGDAFDDPTDRHVAVVLAESVPGVLAAYAQGNVDPGSAQ